MMGVPLQVSGYVIYVDPLTFMLILLGIALVAGIVIWVLIENRNTAISENLSNAIVNSINVQTGIMANTSQAVVNALNTNTTTYQQVAQAEVQNYTKLVDAMVNYLNIIASTYQMEAVHTMNFEDRVLNLLALQAGVQDIRQLQSDKLKASALQAVRTPDVEVNVAENPRLGSQGTGSTR